MMSPATNAIALTEITKQSYYKQFLKHKKKTSIMKMLLLY